MKNLLWVLPSQDETWFQIYTSDTYTCLSGVSSWERVEECLEHFVKTYRTAEEIQEGVMLSTYIGKVIPTEKERLKPLYDEYKDYRRKDINDIIDQAFMTAKVEERTKAIPIKSTTIPVAKPKVIKSFNVIGTSQEEDHDMLDELVSALDTVVSIAPIETPFPGVNKRKVLRHRLLKVNRV